MVKCCQNCTHLGLEKCYTYDDVARWHSNESVVQNDYFYNPVCCLGHDCSKYAYTGCYDYEDRK